jgi:prepilin-type N-terminal cleavage/methylation domain-containing protein
MQSADMHRSSPHRSRAFTLVEIMVVVAIIGLLAAMSLPTYRHITLRSKATAVVTDLRAYSAVFVNYNLSKGAWPTASQPGVVPPEVADAMQSAYSKPSPLGGYYEFDVNSSGNGFHVTAAITLATANGSPVTDDLELLELVDKLIDDGDLSTGSVRLGSTNNLVYIIEQ